MEPANGGSKIWIITGDRQVGKTTFCRELAELAHQAGWNVAGVLSKAVFEAGVKTAIQVQDLRTGAQRTLASTDMKSCRGPVLGSWQFCESALDWGAECLRIACPCDLLVVDELGPLEFERRQGWQAGMEAVSKGEYRRALVVVRPECLDAARRLWAAAQVIQLLKRHPAAG